MGNKKKSKGMSDEERKLLERDFFYPGLSGVAADGECTGLMPTAATNESESESYQQLFETELPETPVVNKNKNKDKDKDKKKS